MASVPFFANIAQSACGTSSTSRSASSTIRGDGPFWQSARARCRSTAASTAGCAWPRTIGPKLQTKSTYSRPSTSQIRHPRPRSRNCGNGAGQVAAF